MRAIEGQRASRCPPRAIIIKATKWRVGTKVLFYGVRPTSSLTNGRPTRPLRIGPSDKKVAKLELRCNGSRNIPCSTSGPAQMSWSPTSQLANLQPCQPMEAGVFSSLSYETKGCGREHLSLARRLDVRARNTAFNRSHFPGGLPDKRSPRDLPFDSLSPIIFTMAWRGCSCSDAVAFLPNIILAIGEIHSRLV